MISLKETTRKYLMSGKSLAFILALLLTACSSPNTKITTIGLVSLSPVLDSGLKAFKIEMACKFNYKEGINVNYVYARPLDTPGITDPAAVDAALQKVIGPDVDLVMSFNTNAVQELKKLTASAGRPPVVFMGIWDPSVVNPVIVPADQVSHPGGNLTGSMSGVTEDKRMEWFKRIVPGIKRLFALYRSTDPAGNLATNQALAAAKKLGIELELKEIKSNDDITAALANIPNDVDGIWLVPDGLIASRSNDFAKAAIQRKLPMSGINPVHAIGGALFSFGFDTTATGVQSARLADQILRGVDPGNIPIEISEFFLYINLDTARAIGITIPNNILLSANEVISNGISATATPLPESCKEAAAALTPSGGTTPAAPTPSAPTQIPTKAATVAAQPTSKDF